METASLSGRRYSGSYSRPENVLMLFLRQLREGVFFILLHGAPQKGGPGIALHHIDRRHAYQNTETGQHMRTGRGNAVAGGNVAVTVLLAFFESP